MNFISIEGLDFQLFFNVITVATNADLWTLWHSAHTIVEIPSPR